MLFKKRKQMIFTALIAFTFLAMQIQPVPAQETTPAPNGSDSELQGPSNGVDPYEQGQTDSAEPGYLTDSLEESNSTSPKPTPLAQVTMQASDTGWYDDSGFHSPSNQNYVAGLEFGFNPWRDFFVFDLSGISHPVYEATLRVYNPSAGIDGNDGYVSSDPSETFKIFEVTTSITSLLNGTGGISAYDDLGSGTSYGEVEVTAASNGTYVEIPLNAFGVAAIRQAMGGDLAIGGALTTIAAGYTQFVFGYTFFPQVELVLKGFYDDFTFGLDNWTPSGLWNLEGDEDPCGALVAPFPSPSSAAYYGQDGVCDFDTGGTTTGSLTLNNPVFVHPDDILSFWSFEETECGGDCAFDNRFIEISNDNGATWDTLGELVTEDTWYKWSQELSAYVGQDVLLRFRFDSVDPVSNDYFGWMVDNVRIGPDLPPTAEDDSSFFRLFGLPIDTSDEIVELDPLTGVELNRFAAPEPPTYGPDGLAFDGESLWFIAASPPFTLYQLNPDTGSTINSTPITAGTGSYDGLAALDGLVYILDYSASDILVFDPTTATVTNTLDIDGLNGFFILGGLAAIQNPGALLVTGMGSLVHEIDPATGLVMNSFAEDVYSNYGVAVLDGQIYMGSAFPPDNFKVYDRMGMHLRTTSLPFSVTALGGDDSFTPIATLEDTHLPATENVLINDSDPEFEPLSIVSFDANSLHSGTVADNGDGTFSYTPYPNYCGPDSFSYMIEDPGGLTDTATVMIEVTCVDDPIFMPLVVK